MACGLLSSVLLLQAWHAYAYINFQAVLFYKQRQSTPTPLHPGEIGSNRGGNSEKTEETSSSESTESVTSLTLSEMGLDQYHE